MSEMFEQPLIPEDPAPPPAPRRSPVLGIVLGIVAVVAVLAVLLFVDPFKWNVLGNVKVLLGLGGDPVAASMPANPTLYMGVDLLNIQPDKINRLYKPFAAIIDPTAKQDANAGLDDLDKELKDSIGITLTDDIMPWAGRSAGVAVKDFKFSQGGSLSSMTLIISIQSRDNARADEFLTKLRNNLEAKDNYKFVQDTYSGVNIFSYQPAGSNGGGFGSGLALARSGDVVLFSLTETGIQAAIDAQKGESMARDSGYQAMVQQLPTDHFLTLYYDVQGYMDLIKQMAGASSAGLSSSAVGSLDTYMAKVKGMVVSASIVDAGLQMDGVVTYNLDKMTPEEQRAYLPFKGPTNTISMLPENTLLFLGATYPNSVWTQAMDMLSSMSGATASEFDQSMAQAEQQIGINPSKDLIPYLNGEIMLAVVPSTEGLLKTSNLNFGAAIIAETSDSKKMMSSVDKVSAAFTAQPSFPLTINPKSAGDLSYYDVVDPSSNLDLFALGVGKQYLVLGTSSTVIEGLFSGKSTLSNNSLYQNAVKTLPNGSTVSTFIDLQGIFTKVRESLSGSTLTQFNQQVKFFEPIPAIIAGGSTVGQNMVKSTFIILVNPVK